MMDYSKFAAMLNAELPDIKFYLDYIPEKKSLPAVSYQHVAHSAARLLDGTKSGQSDTWRLALVVDNIEDMGTLVNQVESLHNTTTNDYQRVFVRIVSGQSQDIDQPNRQTLVDVQTYEA